MTTPSLAGISLTELSDIAIEKKANLIALTMPTEDSDSTEVFDMLGVTKTITISGQVIGSTIAAVYAIINSLEALADGEQNATVDFISDQTGVTAIAVKVQGVSTIWALPGFTASYTIQLIQGV